MKSSKWIQFLGGRNLIFTLVVTILSAVAILLLRQIDFIFYPMVIVFSNIFIPLLIGLVLYYLFNPIISFFEKKKVPRLVSIILFYLVLILLLVWASSAAIPAFYEQIEMLVQAFPGYIESLSSSLEPFFSRFISSDNFNQLSAQVEGLLSDLPAQAVDFLQGGITGLSNVISSVTNVVVTTIFVPVILFFLLKDDKQFAATFINILPPSWRKDFIRVIKEMSNQAGSYVKGQMIIATALGLMTYIGFKIIGLNFAGVLGVTTGLLSVIPYIGPTLSFIPALTIALLSSWFMVVKLLIVWVAVQFIEGNILQPNIMGQQLSIHPLTIIIILFVAGDMAGVFGMIFGVPIYAILKVFILYWFERYKIRYNNYFANEGEEYTLRSTEDIPPIVPKNEDDGNKKSEEAEDHNEDRKD